MPNLVALALIVTEIEVLAEKNLKVRKVVGKNLTVSSTPFFMSVISMSSYLFYGIEK